MEGDHDLLLLGAGGQGQAVDIDILRGDACRQCRIPDAPGDLHTALGCRGDARTIQRQAHDGRTVFFAKGQDAG